MNEATEALAPAPPALDVAPGVPAAEEHAGAFARVAPQEKAARLRTCIPSIVAAAPEMVRAACAAANLDTDALLGAAWMIGPVALLANVRRYAEALEDIAVTGRPTLPPDALRGRLQGRVVARLDANNFAERLLHRDAEALAVFAEGLHPEDVLLAQASAHRTPEATGGHEVARHWLGALEHLFVHGKAVTLETANPDVIERALAPLCEAGWLRVVRGEHARSSVRGVAVVLPAFHAKDELAFITHRLVSEIAAGEAFDVTAPGTILVSGCWAQRNLFVEFFERSLARLPASTRPRLVSKPEPWRGEVSIVALGCDDPIELLAGATARCNAAGVATTELVVHPVQEEDGAVLALERAIVRLRSRVVGINQWPAVLDLRGDGGPHMLSSEKTLVRGPLRSARRPVYFCDHPRGADAGARLAAFHAAPSLGTLARLR
jgi:hypothetical protein